MPVRAIWDDKIKRSRIYIENEGRWTWEEYHDALDQVEDMMASVNRRVDVVTYEIGGAVMPSGTPSPHYQRLGKIVENNNEGLNIAVIPSRMTRMMLETFSRLPSAKSTARFKVASSLDEALDLIQKDHAKNATAVTKNLAP